MTTLLVIALCLVLNALLSAIEMAFVSVGKPELRQKSRTGDKKAFELLRLRENPERTLSVLQIGITLVGAISAAVGGAGADELISPYFQQQFGWSGRVSDAIAIVLVVLPLTYFSVVLGELVPKTFALRQPLRVSLNGLPLLRFGEILLSPVVSVLEISTQLALKVFAKVTPAQQGSHSIESQSLDLGGLSMSHKQLVFNLVNIETKRAIDVLVPWEDVEKISFENKTADVIATMVRCRHTRIPVLSDRIIKGVMHSKEFLSYLAAADENWQKIIRPPLMISPNLPLLSLLRIMQSTKTHMAIVQNQEAQPIGIVTLEDILEEVIGEIYDEDEDGRLKKIMAQRIQELQIKNRPKV
jgi:putative hemolysin